MKDAIIRIVIQALKEINSARFFKTERGFQGRFACALYKVLDAEKIFPDDAIIEQEYQKRLRDHGTTQRPDLIIHVPFETGHAQKRWEDNFVVFAFKKNADEGTAKDDFGKLDIMFKKLKYPIAFFININGYPNISLENYEGNYKRRIHELSNKMEDGKLYIRHGYFEGGKLQIEDV
jgi:hypothetical protein